MDRDHGLWDRVSYWPQASSKSTRENDGLLYLVSIFLPPQVGVQFSLLQKEVDLLQAIARPAAELLLGEVDLFEEINELLAALIQVPLRFEIILQHGQDLVEAHLVGANRFRLHR